MMMMIIPFIRQAFSPKHLAGASVRRARDDDDDNSIHSPN
jgi:hypothetical protein